MFVIKRTPRFDHWFAGLRDAITRMRLAKRLDKLQRGLLGDVRPVGEGVFELRENVFTTQTGVAQVPIRDGMQGAVRSP